MDRFTSGKYFIDGLSASGTVSTGVGTAAAASAPVTLISDPTGATYSGMQSAGMASGVVGGAMTATAGAIRLCRPPPNNKHA
jgi:hypothetical protein